VNQNVLKRKDHFHWLHCTRYGWLLQDFVQIFYFFLCFFTKIYRFFTPIERKKPIFAPKKHTNYCQTTLYAEVFTGDIMVK